MSNILGPRTSRGENRGARLAKGRNDRFAYTLGTTRDEGAFPVELQVIAHE
jgi:hypothetical protein